MSESIKHSGPEKAPKLEQKEAKGKLDQMREKLSQSAEKAKSGEHNKEKTEARQTAEKLAISGKEQAPSGSENKQDNEPVHRSLKKQTYKATMKRVEAKLPNYQRKFSKVINNNTVDKVSNVASKTVARPSAMLGGGLVAFVALLATTYYAGKYGWQVTGSEFFVFVLVGWAGGLTVEGIIKLVRR